MKKTISSILLVGGLALTAGAHAASIIDDFSTDTAFITAPGSETSAALGASSDFSTQRVLTISENPAGPGGANFIVTGGELGISAGFATGSDTTSAYSNAAGFDFTTPEVGGSVFDTFVLSLLSIDQGGVDITLTVDGVSSSQFVNAVGDVLFAHSLFGDVSSVNSIDLFVHNNVAVDATFDSLGSFGSQQVTPPGTVPEPDAFLLIGAGLLGFAGFRARKSS